MKNIWIWISNYCYTKPKNWFAEQKMCFTRLILKGDFNANIKESVWKKYLINHMKNGDLSDHVINTRSKNQVNKTSRVILFGLILLVWRLQRDHILECWLQCLYVSPKVVWKTPIHCIRGSTGWPLLPDFNSRKYRWDRIWAFLCMSLYAVVTKLVLNTLNSYQFPLRPIPLRHESAN